MKLKEYLAREKTGEAFIEVVEWMRHKRQSNIPILPHEMSAKQRETILRYGGYAVGIKAKGVIMDDVSI